MSTYQLQLPIIRSTVYGLKHIENVEESIKQDFKMLLLTVPGEKIDNPDYGCGIITYIFENDSPISRKNLEDLIREKTKRFLPLINIIDIFFEYNDQNSMLNMEIKFFIGSLETLNQISFTLPVIEQ